MVSLGGTVGNSIMLGLCFLAAGKCRTIPGIVQEPRHLHSCCHMHLWAQLIFCSAHFLAFSNGLSNHTQEGQIMWSCSQHISLLEHLNIECHSKNHLGLGDYFNSTKQVAFSGLSLVKQVFRGILTTRNHDVGDLLLKNNNKK